MAVAVNSQLNPLENAERQFEEAATRLRLDPGVKDMLKKPRRATIQWLPVMMDDGAIRMFEGFRVHGLARQVFSRGELIVENGKYRIAAKLQHFAHAITGDDDLLQGKHPIYNSRCLHIPTSPRQLRKASNIRKEDGDVAQPGPRLPADA